MNRTTIATIRSGAKTHIRAQTERRILACGAGAAADGVHVDAERTWKQLRWLMEEGFTRREIARRLGSKAKVPSLQLRRDRVTRLNAERVQRLYDQFYKVAA